MDIVSEILQFVGRPQHPKLIKLIDDFDKIVYVNPVHVTSIEVIGQIESSLHVMMVGSVKHCLSFRSLTSARLKAVEFVELLNNSL